MNEKLNKQFIDQKINPIIEPMAFALFAESQVDEDPVSIKIYSNLCLKFVDRFHDQLPQEKFRKPTQCC